MRFTPNEKTVDFERNMVLPRYATHMVRAYAQFRVMQLAKAKNNTKVVLDGQGGGELFAGPLTLFFTTYVNELLRNKQFKQNRFLK